MIKRKHYIWLNAIRPFIIVLFSQSATFPATLPAFRPMPMAQKLEYSDSVFLGTVRELHFMDNKNSKMDPSQVKGLAGSTAEVEVSEVIVDRKKKLKSVVLVPLGDPTS